MHLLNDLEWKLSKQVTIWQIVKRVVGVIIVHVYDPAMEHKQYQLWTAQLWQIGDWLPNISLNYSTLIGKVSMFFNDEELIEVNYTSF